VKLENICGTNSHNRQTKGQPGVGVVKIFCDSDSSGSKSLRLDSPGGNTGLDHISSYYQLFSMSMHRSISSFDNATDATINLGSCARPLANFD